MLSEAKTHSPQAARVPHASRRQDGAPGGRYSGPPVEQLARESGYPLEFVQDLYQRELVSLEHDARIRSYIPVLAMKRVRDALRARQSAAHTRSRVRPHRRGHPAGHGGR